MNFNLTEGKADQNRLECMIHGQSPWLAISIDSDHQFFCLVCLREALTRIGVHGMFPVSKPEPVEQWPENLEV